MRRAAGDSTWCASVIASPGSPPDALVVRFTFTRDWNGRIGSGRSGSRSSAARRIAAGRSRISSRTRACLALLTQDFLLTRPERIELIPIVRPRANLLLDDCGDHLRGRANVVVAISSPGHLDRRPALHHQPVIVVTIDE